MDNVFDTVEAGFSDAVQRLRDAAEKFSAVYNQFISIPVEYRSPTWEETKNRADNVRGVIQTFTNAIDIAYGWLKSAFGLSGFGQLGAIIPAVPWLTVASIGGAISAIMVAYSYMVEELNKSAYKKQLMEQNIIRIQKGLEPLDLTELMQTGPSIFGDTAALVKWAVIGGAAIFIVPKILEKMKGV